MLNIPDSKQLLEAGVHFGHQVRRGNPKMKPYIYGVKDGVHVIDLTISEVLLKEACEFAYKLGIEGKVLLFVGTKKQARPIVEELAKKVGAPYLTSRWMGGFLTNFEELSKNIQKLKDLKDQKEKGQLKRYTKKEQLLIDRRISKLNLDLAGVLDMNKIPSAVFIIDTVAEQVAVKEANKLGFNDAGKVVSIIAISDSNSNPAEIDFPIPGNDDAIKSITILTTAIATAYGDGLKEAGIVAAKAEAKAAADKTAEELALSQKVAEEAAAAEEELEKKVVKESERKVD